MNCLGDSRSGSVWVISWLIAVFLLTGCKSSNHVAPIDQLEQPPAIRISQHKVSRGDTLYSIAWRYSMDYRQIAQLNNIQSPYTIYVGQKLDLGKSQRRDVASYGSGTTAEVLAVPDSGYAAGGGEGVREVNGVREIASSGAASSATEVRVAEANPPLVEETAAKPVKEGAPASSVPAGEWLWPAKGRLTGRFSNGDPLKKGIDIEGSPGAPVQAAAAGSVVYAGNGLAGYGELVIVKHNETFLSAYAHNSKLLVGEGEQVRAGQAIAEMGSSGTDKTKLHFEIRQAGKPVDPLLYLPVR